MNVTPNKTSFARTAFKVCAPSLHGQTYRKQLPETQSNCELCEGRAWVSLFVSSPAPGMVSVLCTSYKYLLNELTSAHHIVIHPLHHSAPSGLSIFGIWKPFSRATVLLSPYENVTPMTHCASLFTPATEKVRAKTWSPLSNCEGI